MPTTPTPRAGPVVERRGGEEPVGGVRHRRGGRARMARGAARRGVSGAIRRTRRPDRSGFRRWRGRHSAHQRRGAALSQSAFPPQGQHDERPGLSRARVRSVAVKPVIGSNARPGGRPGAGFPDPIETGLAPIALPRAQKERSLGDIALAFGACSREAAEQGKRLGDHLRHLTVHGVLHLLGYDHQTEGEAALMEARECELLASLGVADPYA